MNREYQTAAFSLSYVERLIKNQKYMEPESIRNYLITIACFISMRERLTKNEIECFLAFVERIDPIIKLSKRKEFEAVAIKMLKRCGSSKDLFERYRNLFTLKTQNALDLKSSTTQQKV